MQRRHQEIAGTADAVAGEHAAGAVRAVRRRREADEQQARVGITEPGYGPAPVDLIAKRAPLLPRNPRAVVAEPRAEFAGDDLRLNVLQCRARFCSARFWSASLQASGGRDLLSRW